MDAEALRTFLAVYRQQGFSNAAQRLHRTQPAISRRISLLERELGAPLFERGASGTMLSQAGRVLLPYAERALAALQDAENAVRTLASTASGPVTLAVVGTLAGTRLTRILRRFARAHPDVDFSLRTAASAEVSDLVRRGEAIIGLRYFDDVSADLNCETISTEALVVACAHRHPLAGRTIKSLAALQSERWLAFPEVPGRREIAASHIFALFLAHGLGEIPWTPVDSLTAQKRLVEAGFGLALLPQSGIGEELASRTLATIHVRDMKVSQPITVVTRNGGFLSPASQRLRDMLRNAYRRGRG